MSVNVSANDVLNVLSGLKDPIIGEPIGHKIKANDIVLDGSKATIRFKPGYFCSAADQGAIQQQIEQLLVSQGITSVQLNWVNGVEKHKVQDGLKPIETIKNIIAVASGKGGVGKSTTSVNLAIALAQSGANVGILDADIYGPSQPLLLGLRGKPELDENKHMIPPKAHGVYVNSFGFLLNDDQAAIWRGPMVVQALNQLLSLTAWPELDYLIVDMPPGTGDIALSMAQKIPVAGSVIVTTPQDLALLDVRKGVDMFNKVNVPILGIVENMSVHVCSKCGHEEHIFGEHGGENMAATLKLPYLGGLPLAMQVREFSDAGKPIVSADPQADASQRYRLIARKVAINVSNQPLDMAHKFPPIVVKH